MSEEEIVQPEVPAIKVGSEVEVEVFKIASFGAFVTLPNQSRGMIHISQVADSYVKDINEHLKVGDRVKARIVNIAGDGKIDLSLKTARPESQHGGDGRFQDRRHFGGGRGRSRDSGFESKLKSFLKHSEERLADIKKNKESKIGAGKMRRK